MHPTNAGSVYSTALHACTLCKCMSITCFLKPSSGPTNGMSRRHIDVWNIGIISGCYFKNQHRMTILVLVIEVVMVRFAYIEACVY